MLNILYTINCKNSIDRFIATATIGFDHIDTEYCHQAGIVWKNAPGCNSASVAQYLQSTLLLTELLKGKIAHGTAQKIGFAEAETAHGGSDLHNLFLIKNDAVRIFKNGF